jgi:DNA-binding protein H-NS
MRVEGRLHFRIPDMVIRRKLRITLDNIFAKRIFSNGKPIRRRGQSTGRRGYFPIELIRDRHNMAESSEASSKRKSPFDLDSMSAQDLTALIEAAEAKRSEKQDEARNALIEEFRGKAAELGLELESLIPSGATPPGPAARRTRRDAGGSVAARFRGPNGETWSGRGRMPKWLSAMEAQGRKREEFRI